MAGQRRPGRGPKQGPSLSGKISECDLKGVEEEISGWGRDVRVKDGNIHTAIDNAVVCKSQAKGSEDPKDAEKAVENLAKQHQIIKLLVANGARLDEVSRGETPLSKATAHGLYVPAAAILEHGGAEAAKIDHQGWAGKTAYHHAVGSPDPDDARKLTSLMIEHDADPTLKSSMMKRNVVQEARQMVNEAKSEKERQVRKDILRRVRQHAWKAKTRKLMRRR